MNYKRMISLLLAFVMVLGMLSGCSGEPDAPQESQAGNQETMVDEEIQKAIDLGLVPKRCRAITIHRSVMLNSVVF